MIWIVRYFFSNSVQSDTTASFTGGPAAILETA